MSETLQIFGTTFSNINGLYARDINKDWLNYIIPSGSLSIKQNGTFDCFNYLNVIAVIQTGVQIGALLKVSSGTIPPDLNPELSDEEVFNILLGGDIDG